MAGVIEQPGEMRPCYNDLYFVYNPNNTGINIHSQFDLYINSTLVSSTPLYPDTNSLIYYNPYRIIQNYLDVSYSELFRVKNEGTYETADYYVKITDIWTDISGYTNSALSYSSDTKTVWMAFFDPENFQSYYTGYTTSLLNGIWTYYSATTGEYLNVRDYTGYYHIKDTECFYLTSFLSGVNSIYVKTETGKIYIWAFTMTATPLSYFDVGVAALNAISWDTTPGSAITALDGGYEVIMCSDALGVSPAFKTVKFKIDNCIHWTDARIIYRTSIGGYGYIPTRMKITPFTTTERKTYERLLPNTYSYGFNPTKAYGAIIQNGWVMNTDILDNDAKVYEVINMTKSNDIILVYDGKFYPVNVESATYNQDIIKQRKTDCQYEIKLTSSFKTLPII